MLRLRDLEAGGRLKSPFSFWAEVVDEPFSFRDSVGEVRSSEDWPVGDFCPFAAAAAACCAKSLREAFPRFLRSRIYSQPKPNSISGQPHPDSFLAGDSPTQWAQGLCPSHLVRSWLHWSHALLIRRRIGPEAPLLTDLPFPGPGPYGCWRCLLLWLR